MMRVLLTAILAAAAVAAEVRVDASCPWEDKDGYTPVLLRVEALVAPVDVRIEVRLGDARATDVVHAMPGRTATRTLLVPCNSGWGSPMLRWSAVGDAGENGVGVDNGYRALALAVLDPREQVPVPALTKLATDHAPASSSGRGGYRSGSGDRVRRLPADALPDRWQGWPAWLTLLTTRDGEAQLSQAQREAIATWTRAGGTLFVTDAASLADWRRLGAIATRIDAAAAEQPVLIDRLRRAEGEDGRPAEHPVPGTDSVPTGWFLTLAIAFAVVAGPINVIWAMRRKRPFLLLISTPLISVGTCVLLIAIALLSDGIGRRRSAAQIAVLDGEAQRVVAFSAVTWFCGIAPGGVAADPEDRVLPMDAADWGGGWRRDRPELGIDWGAGQVLDAGWIPARVNRQLAFTQVRPERRRVTFMRAAGGWRIGNGLDVAIDSVHWCDPAGAVWSATGIASGQEMALQPARSAVAAPDLVGRLGVDARLALDGAGRKPGTYLARLAKPLLPVPGPVSEDVGAPEGWLAGHVGGEAGTASAPAVEGF